MPTETISIETFADAELTADDLQRGAWLAGMRELLDWLEAHPEVPLPYLDTSIHNEGQGVPALVHYVHAWEDNARGRIAAIARAMGKARKTVNDATEKLYVSRRFGGAVDYVAAIARGEVCVRKVVGTREVTEDVPDPEHVAAAPLVTVTKIVEDVEWVCGPVLDEQARAHATAAAILTPDAESVSA